MNLKKRIIIINKVVNKNKRFFNNDILLLLYLYRLKIKIIYSLIYQKRLYIYLFIYLFIIFRKLNFYYFN